MTYETLKARLDGTALTRFDPGHADACDALIWNGRKPGRRASVIVRAAGARDVATALRYAADHGLTVSARCGGHQFSGIAAQADVVIDLGALDHLRIDPGARRAIVGPAVTNERLAAALDRHGLAFPVGHCGSVTLGGYLLGGGVGWNSGAWGIACFGVRAVEVVLADGQAITATADSHADVFWAARGGGPGFFGIVTAFLLDLFEAPRAPMTVVRVWPADRAAEIATWAEAALARAPETVEFTAKVAPGPGGAPVIAAIATVFAATEAEAVAVLDDLGQGAPAGALACIGPAPTPFAALYAETAASTPQGGRYGVDCFWSDAAPGPVLDRAVAAIAAAPSPHSFALVALRSNARPVPTDAAAFSRAGRIFATLYGVWTDPEDDAANLAWLRATTAAAADIASGRYVGEADLDHPGPVAPTLSAEAAARLAALARQHDPAGIFARPLTPAGRSAA